MPFEAYADLARELERLTADAPDLLFMAAAVSDYTPVRQPGKIRSSADELTIRLTKTPKILAGLRERCGVETFLAATACENPHPHPLRFAYAGMDPWKWEWLQVDANLDSEGDSRGVKGSQRRGSRSFGPCVVDLLRNQSRCRGSVSAGHHMATVMEERG